MSADLARPSIEELQAPPSWKTVDFISDLHLSAETPAGFRAWSNYLKRTTADAVFILGDLFEVWVGDDVRHVGFERQCSEVLAAAAQVRSIYFMRGNRDFLVGNEFLEACGVGFLEDPTVLSMGRDRLLLTHGDELCIGDVEYQRFRRTVRSEAWQRNFLALPLSQRKDQALQMREQSRQRKLSQTPEQWVDVDGPTAVAWMKAAGTPTLIHGHTHRPAVQSLAPGFVRYVLSDWELDHSAKPRSEVLRWRDAALSRQSPGA